MDDAPDLIERARSGDEAALARLVDVYAPRVWRFGRKLCGGSIDAEDVAQQTLLSVVNHIGEFRGDSHFASWLFSIARNHCIKQRTRGASGQPTQPLERVRDASLTQTSPGPEELFSKEQLASALDVAIAALEPAQREVLLLRDVEGLSATQVAQALGLSVDAVKSRLHRARKTLRDELAPWFEQTTPAPACPDVVDLLSRYQEGDVTSEACKTMELHVEACPQCATRCHSLRSVLSACSATPVPVLPAELQRAVREQIRRSLKRQTG